MSSPFKSKRETEGAAPLGASTRRGTLLDRVGARQGSAATRVVRELSADRARGRNVLPRLLDLGHGEADSRLCHGAHSVVESQAVREGRARVRAVHARRPLDDHVDDRPRVLGVAEGAIQESQRAGLSQESAEGRQAAALRKAS